MCVTIVKDKRPVNLDIQTIHLPFQALVSITHRITGVISFVGIGILLYMLDVSLESEAGFAGLKELMDLFLVKFVIWGVTAALIYHTIAGVKHLIMDIGIGETLEGGLLGARLVAGLSAVLMLLAIAWIF